MAELITLPADPDSRSQTLPHTKHTPDPHNTTKRSPQSAEQHPQQSSRHGGAQGRQAAGKCHFGFPHKEGGWWASNVCTCVGARIAALPLSSFAGDVYGCACGCLCAVVRLSMCCCVWLSVCCCVWLSVCCCVWLSVCCHPGPRQRQGRWRVSEG